MQTAFDAIEALSSKWKTAHRNPFRRLRKMDKMFAAARQASTDSADVPLDLTARPDYGLRLTLMDVAECTPQYVSAWAAADALAGFIAKRATQPSLSMEDVTIGAGAGAQEGSARFHQQRKHPLLTSSWRV